jgi:RNA polymerase sigma factor (sigma-70 family)
MTSAKAKPVDPPLPADDPTPNTDALYRRHRGWLLRFIQRRFGNHIAEDVAQEAFARTLRIQAEIRNPRAFLAKVAMRAALEEVGKRPDSVAPLPPAEVQPESDQAVLLEQLILNLPPPLREVFLLSRFGGLSNVEIAHRCNLSVKRVEARITKARAMCAALMQD